MKYKIENSFTSIMVPAIGDLWMHPGGNAAYFRISTAGLDGMCEEGIFFYSVSLSSAGIHGTLRDDARGFLILKLRDETLVLV